MVPRWRTAGSPIEPGTSASTGSASFTTCEFATSPLLGHGADHDRAAAQLDARQAFDLAQIDEVGGLGEPQLHHRNERVTSGKELGLRVLGQQIRRLPHRGGAVIFEFIHRSRFPDSEARCGRRSSRGRRRSLHGFRARRDRLDDVVVAGATAQVAVELLSDGVLVEFVCPCGSPYRPPTSPCRVCRIRTAGRGSRGRPPASDAAGRPARPALRSSARWAPSHCSASVVQDFTAMPFRMNEAGAALRRIAADMGAGERRCSRRNWTRSVRESTSAVTALPFTVIETDGIGIPPQTRAERPVFFTGRTTRHINRRANLSVFRSFRSLEQEQLEPRPLHWSRPAVLNCGAASSLPPRQI